MSKKTLEQEAEEFKKQKTPKPTQNKTALRYYLGCALGGLIASGGSRVRPEEILREALLYARLAEKSESEF